MSRDPKWKNSNVMAQSEQLSTRRQARNEEEDLLSDADNEYQQQLILKPPRNNDPETVELMKAVERVQNSFTKAFCTEIKALNNPPEEVLRVIVTFADFVEGEAGVNTF